MSYFAAALENLDMTVIGTAHYDENGFTFFTHMPTPGPFRTLQRDKKRALVR